MTSGSAERNEEEVVGMSMMKSSTASEYDRTPFLGLSDDASTASSVSARNGGSTNTSRDNKQQQLQNGNAGIDGVVENKGPIMASSVYDNTMDAVVGDYDDDNAERAMIATTDEINDGEIHLDDALSPLYPTGNVNHYFTGYSSPGSSVFTYGSRDEWLVEMDLLRNVLANVTAKLLSSGGEQQHPEEETSTVLALKCRAFGDGGAKEIADFIIQQQENAHTKEKDAATDHNEDSNVTKNAQAIAKITTIDLTDNEIGNSGATALANALRTNTLITTLNLRYQKIGDTGAAAIAQMLQSNTTLLHLDLLDNSIGVTGTRAIANSLQFHNTTLLTLNLGFQDEIGEEGMQALADALATPTCKLTKIALLENSVSDTGATAIAIALQNNPNTQLQILDICKNEIGGTGATAVAQATSRLETINMGCQEIGDAGAIAFAVMLQRPNCTVQKLAIPDNHMTNACIDSFGIALQANTVLTMLDLSSNDSITSIQSIALSLPMNRTLIKLNLQSIPLGDDGATQLAIGLQNNRALETLEVSSCQISDPGGIAFATHCLQSNTTLQTLDLEYNLLSTVSATAFLEVLTEYNDTLLFLAIQGNPFVDDLTPTATTTSTSGDNNENENEINQDAAPQKDGNSGLSITTPEQWEQLVVPLLEQNAEGVRPTPPKKAERTRHGIHHWLLTNYTKWYSTLAAPTPATTDALLLAETQLQPEENKSKKAIVSDEFISDCSRKKPKLR